MTEPCSMQGIIMEHAKAIGKIDGKLDGMASDLTHIKDRVDNGLSTKVDRIDKEVAKSVSNGKIEAEKIKKEIEVAAANLRGENWFGRILQGSMVKLIGMGIVFLILNAIVTSGAVQFVKEKYSLETPGQQKAIFQKQVDMQSTLNGYHYHTLPDGRVLQHSGDATKPAWILNSTTNTWEKAPAMRTEEGIKQ